MESTNPIHEEDGKWYFWDETWSDRHGPYDSEWDCRKMLKRYCIECLGIEESDFKEG